MINSSKPPSGLRKALVLPVLLAAMVLACSKEQNAPAQAQIPKSLSLTVAGVKAAKILRDSVKSINFVYVTGNNRKNGQAQIILDTLGSKVKLDLQQADEIKIEGKVPDYKTPPPSPSVKD